MKLTIGIKVLDEAERIARAIETALEAAEPFGGEVVVADSGSTDGTLDIAARYDVKIVQLANPSERSCGAGAQLAYRFARGEFFYLLDGDMEIDRSFLPKAIPFLEMHPDFAGVGGRIEEANADNHEFRTRKVNAEKNSAYFPRLVDRLDCGGLYRVSAVKACGYFADRNLKSFEEFELASRLICQGWKLTRIDVPAVVHYGHSIESYKLLRTRLLTGYANGVGQVFRAVLGQPHWRQALSKLTQVRTCALVVIWWAAIVALTIAAGSDRRYLTYLVVAFAGPILFLMLRRGSFQGGLYSFVAWNAVALGFFAGLAASRRPPTDQLDAVIIKG
ncbi:glycosyltransferase family 2 protein [Methylobacterium sp. P5_C11]